MGSTAAEDDLTGIGVEVIGVSESGSYKLRIPEAKLSEYADLVSKFLKPGFWNEYISEDIIHFIFKHKDGQIEEIDYTEENRDYIAKLCSQFNGDDLEKTSRLLEYLADNDFYAELINTYYLAKND